MSENFLSSATLKLENLCASVGGGGGDFLKEKKKLNYDATFMLVPIVRKESSKATITQNPEDLCCNNKHAAHSKERYERELVEGLIHKTKC